MRRNNQRFYNRMKVRETAEERISYLEKVKDILIRNTQVQDVINKELRGKHVSTVKKVLKLHEVLKTMPPSDTTPKFLDDCFMSETKEELEDIRGKLDVMEEILEDLS